MVNEGGPAGRKEKKNLRGLDINRPIFSGNCRIPIARVPAGFIVAGFWVFASGGAVSRWCGCGLRRFRWGYWFLLLVFGGLGWVFVRVLPEA